MKNLYIEIGIGPKLLNVSTINYGATNTPAILDDESFYFDKFEGYKIQVLEDGYHISFDEEQYQAYLAEIKKQEAIEEGNKKAEELADKAVLDNASDIDAYTMRYLYDEWAPLTKYEVKDRKRYGDNLYKCKQAHTSEEGPDRTPDKLPALWDVVNGDPSKGTKENPIPIPESFSSMVYTYGNYYLEDSTLYLCKRGGVPDPESMYGQEISLAFKPSALIGQYFEVVEE